MEFAEFVDRAARVTGRTVIVEAPPLAQTVAAPDDADITTLAASFDYDCEWGDDELVLRKRYTDSDDLPEVSYSAIESFLACVPRAVALFYTLAPPVPGAHNARLAELWSSFSPEQLPRLAESFEGDMLTSKPGGMPLRELRFEQQAWIREALLDRLFGTPMRVLKQVSDQLRSITQEEPIFQWLTENEVRMYGCRLASGETIALFREADTVVEGRNAISKHYAGTAGVVITSYRAYGEELPDTKMPDSVVVAQTVKAIPGAINAAFPASLRRYLQARETQISASESDSNVSRRPTHTLSRARAWEQGVGVLHQTATRRFARLVDTSFGAEPISFAELGESGKALVALLLASNPGIAFLAGLIHSLPTPLTDAANAVVHAKMVSPRGQNGIHIQIDAPQYEPGVPMGIGWHIPLPLALQN